MVTGASESCGISVGPDQQCEYPPDIPSRGITHLLPSRQALFLKLFTCSYNKLGLLGGRYFLPQLFSVGVAQGRFQIIPQLLSNLLLAGDIPGSFDFCSTIALAAGPRHALTVYSHSQMGRSPQGCWEVGASFTSSLCLMCERTSLFAFPLQHPNNVFSSVSKQEIQ